MKSKLLPFAAFGTLIASGCEPTVEAEPQAVATTVAALDGESIYGPFALTGKIKFGETTCGGTLRRVQDLRVRFRDINFTTTGVFADAVAGAHDPDFARNYSAAPQRDVNGDFITYQWRNNSFPGHQNSRFFYGGTGTNSGSSSSREFRYGVGDFAAPVAGDLVQNLNEQNLASMTLEMTSPRLSLDDDIVSVTITADASGTPDFVGLFNSGICVGDGRNSTDSGDCNTLVPGSTAKQVNGFIRQFTYSGLDIVSQRVSTELLLLPGRSYSLAIRAQYRDGITVRVDKTLTAAEVTPCRDWSMTPETHADLAIARPAQNINFSVFLESPEYNANPTLGGPRPIAYYNTFFRIDDAGAATTDRTGYSSGGTNIAHDSSDGVTPSTPFSFQWRGVEPGRWRMDNTASNSAAGWLEDGHVVLDWGDASEAGYRPEFRLSVGDTGTNAAFRPVYRWPRSGAVPAGEVTTASLGLDASGHFFMDPDEATQQVNRHAKMAYLRGAVTLLGCDLEPANIAAGAVELDGVGDASGGAPFTDERLDARTAATGIHDAFARGLFRAGSHPTEAGQFEVAGSAGNWKVKAYRLRLDGIGADPYNGDLSIWPSDSTIYSLVAGRANENTLPLTAGPEFQVSTIGITMSAPGMLLRRPTLTIGRDIDPSGPERIPYTDLGGTTLGTYVARSVDETTPATTSTSAFILALANSTVTVRASAEVSTDGGTTWNTSSFPPIENYQLSGSCGTCFVNGVPVSDDGVGPAIEVNGGVAIPIQPENTTEFTLTGTAIDAAVPVVSVKVGADFMTLVPDAISQTFTTLVTGLVPGVNVITIVAKDCVGKSTSIQVTIIVAEPLCPPEETPDMCLADPTGAPATGSVFYISVVRDLDDVVCQLACRTDAAGSPLDCDAAPVCPN